MESFHVILTTEDISIAHKTCEVLERRGVSLLLEHIEVIKDDGEQMPSYRLSVPSSKKQLSIKLVCGIATNDSSRILMQ